MLPSSDSRSSLSFPQIGYFPLTLALDIDKQKYAILTIGNKSVTIVYEKDSVRFDDNYCH